MSARNKVWRLILLGLLALQAPAVAAALQPVELIRIDDPSQFRFLAPLLQGVEVVSLGESIHLTREFPLVRLAMIRYLHASLQFEVLAMEGSAEDLWVAQDRLLHSPRGRRDAGEALGGLFPLWNTAEIRQLFEYEISTWGSARPFYITAYDIQPGSGSSFRGAEVFRELAERLLAYAPPPPGFERERWIADLAPIESGCAAYHPADAGRVEAGIQILEQWAGRTAPAVETRFPRLPHATALRLLPANLRASLRLCQELGGDGRRYKEVRDTQAAQYTLELKGAVPGQKLILWAHLSHVFHNAGHQGISVGEVLHRNLGPRLYTVTAFAESGNVTFLAGNDPLYGPVQGRLGELGRHLGRLSRRDYFLDLRAATAGAHPDVLWTTPQTVQVEAGAAQLTLAADFDGILWIKRIHPPRLLDPRLEKLLRPRRGGSRPNPPSSPRSRAR